MKKYQWIIQLMILLSLIFLIVYLVKFDYLAFADIQFQYGYLIASVLLLWFGFLLSAFSWKKALRAHKINSTYPEAIYSHGIAVFGKYLPGKIWVILGRASYYSKKGNTMLSASTISLKEQLVYLMIGLIISLLALILLPINPTYNYIVLATVVGLGVFLFSRKIHDFALKTLQKIIKKTISIPFVGMQGVMPYASINVLLWITWSAAFYLLCQSITPDAPIISGFAFPIGVCYGLLVIFTPGGIGVREGILTFFLISAGVEPATATAISVISRLWFISGELFIFVAALFIKKSFLSE